MKNKIIIIFVLFLVGILFFNINSSKAAGDIGIYIDETEHTVVFPYEKSFRMVAKIINHSDEEKRVKVEPQGEMSEGGHLLMPVGQYQLSPGQEAHCVGVFEVNTDITKDSKSIKESEITIPIKFSWDGGEETHKITIKKKTLPFQNKKDELSNLEFTILDKKSNKPINNAVVTLMLASGMEQKEAEFSNNVYYISAPSKNYLEKIYNEYKIDLKNKGYFLQISADEYKSYFKSDFEPKEGEDKRTLSLEPLKQIGDYKLRKTIKTGYSIWWIKSSENEQYIVLSQGAHGQPNAELPSYSKVLLLNKDGELLWENETGGECWGVDITPDGQYISAGCYDGKIYLWNKNGDKLWEYANEQGNTVRWVKFSEDGKYLLSGPVNNKPEESGIFEVGPTVSTDSVRGSIGESGNLKWSYYTGDWLREGRFSADGSAVYFDSANGLIHALDTKTGDLKWIGNGDHYIPFMLSISEETKQIYSVGKGRAFTSLELDTGKFRWEVPVDQTITAANAVSDGSIVGASVGGIIYKLNKEGEILWARNYGGVGHNGVHYTNNGKYILLGGPNPTLLDSEGNVLWQKDPDEEIPMTGPAEQWTGGANEVFLSEDASLIIIGQDDGDVQFYKGEIKEGENKLNQVIGPMARDIEEDGGIFEDFEFNKNKDTGKEIELPPLPFLIAVGALIVILIVIIAIVVRMRKR